MRIGNSNLEGSWIYYALMVIIRYLYKCFFFSKKFLWFKNNYIVYNFLLFIIILIKNLIIFFLIKNY